MKKDIKNFTISELEKILMDMGEAKHRGKQIFLWLNSKNVENFSEMRNIPRTLIADLEKHYTIGKLECVDTVVSADSSTEKYLWRLEDGEYVETVLIKQKKPEDLMFVHSGRM